MEEPKPTNRANDFGKKGWALIILCLLAAFCSSAASGSLNVGAAHFIEVTGATQTQLMLGATIGQLIGALIGAVGGNFFTKRSPRKWALILAIIYAISFFLNGMSVRYWQFMITFIIFMASIWIVAFMCCGALVSNWFPRKRGLAMGWITIGMPLGGAVAANVMMFVANHVGFRASYIPYALLALVVAILFMVILRDYPADCGCYPDNDRNFDMERMKEEEAKMKQLQASSPWTVGRVFSCRQFWFIALCIGCMMFASGFMAQVVPTMVSFGVAMTAAPKFMLLVAGCACVGSYVMGLADQKIGSKRAIIITSILMIAMGLIEQINFLPTKIIGFCLMGLVQGAGTNYMLSIIMHHWGQRSSMNIYRYAQPICTVISALSTTIISAVAAAAGGNYNISFLLCSGLAVVSIILIIFVRDGFVAKKEEKFAEKDKEKQIQAS